MWQKLYIFLKDFQKQREEIERLHALLTQHNITFDSKQSKWIELSSPVQVVYSANIILCNIFVADEAKGTVSATVKDQHLLGDNGLLDPQ